MQKLVVPIIKLKTITVFCRQNAISFAWRLPNLFTIKEEDRARTNLSVYMMYFHRSDINLCNMEHSWSCMRVHQDVPGIAYINGKRSEKREDNGCYHHCDQVHGNLDIVIPHVVLSGHHSTGIIPVEARLVQEIPDCPVHIPERLVAVLKDVLLIVGSELHIEHRYHVLPCSLAEQVVIDSIPPADLLQH